MGSFSVLREPKAELGNLSLGDRVMRPGGRDGAGAGSNIEGLEPGPPIFLAGRPGSVRMMYRPRRAGGVPL